MPHISINKSNSSDDDFFSRFGRYESVRQKKKQEMINDYKEYLRLEEQKFNNRFADKKLSSTTQIYPLPEYAPSNVSDVISAQSCDHIHEYGHHHDHTSEVTQDSSRLPQLSEMLGVCNNSRPSFEANLDKRLQEIERKIENVNVNLRSTLGNNTVNPRTLQPNDGASAASATTHATFSSERYSVSANPESADNNAHNSVFSQPDMSYEMALKQRLELISEAEKRLVSIEDEYRRVKNLQNRYQIKMDDNSTMNATSENFGISIANSDSETKLKQQEKYRLELEAQIAEMKKRRELEKAANKASNNQDHFTTTNDSIQNAYHTNGVTEYFITGNKELIESKLDGIRPSDNLSIESISKITSNFDDTSKEKNKKAQYANELKKQIEEARLRKEKIKKEDDEYNRKMDLQLMNYDPYSAIEKQRNENVIKSRLDSALPLTSILHNSDHDNKAQIKEQSFARGGHGIFGSPLTEVQKTNLQHYKEELSKQIAEKQWAVEQERQREIEIERKELKKIEEERIRMQKEFEAEEAKRKLKQEKERKTIEANAKTEEIKKQKKLEKEAKIEERKNSRNKEIQLKTIEKPKSRKPVRVERSKELKSPELLIGPEIKLAKDKVSHQKQPELIETDKKTKTVLQQLHFLRSQLEIEKERVESVLLNSRKTSVCDPRLLSKLHPKVDKQAHKLFESSQNHNNNNANTNKPANYMELDDTRYITNDISFWETIVQKDHAVNVIDEKQKAYLRAHEKYLHDLQSELDKFNAENRVHKLKDARIKKSQTDGHDSGQSNESIDLIGLNNRNQQRMKSLEAMQLLNDVDTDPEMILERFISKHDHFYPNIAKSDLY